ncbi:hypothetical protein [Novipirellula galeiformis]|nr:hypothetical protein [Novipirellula galeiformis]
MSDLEQWPLLVQLDYFRPDGLQGWTHNPSKTNVVSKLLGRSKSDLPHDKRIDWLPRDWPNGIPAPITVTAVAISQWCSYITKSVQCCRRDNRDGNLIGVAYSDEAESIAMICRAAGVVNVMAGKSANAMPDDILDGCVSLIDALATAKRRNGGRPEGSGKPLSKDETDALQFYDEGKKPRDIDKMMVDRGAKRGSGEPWCFGTFDKVKRARNAKRKRDAKTP